MLLKLFGISGTHSDQHHSATPPAKTEYPTSIAPVQRAEASNRDLTAQLIALGQTVHQIDKLAVYYGQLNRSSVVSRYLLIIFVAFLSGLTGILLPSKFATSLILQVAVTLFVLLDAKIGGRQRRQERWLDYRSLAERLRSLRFLHPLGVGPVAPKNLFGRDREAWTDWYVRHTARGLRGPVGTMCEQEIAAAAEQLVTIEIPEQVNYHREVFRQLGTFERRLALAANMALAAAIGVAATLGIAAYILGSVDLVWWKPIASVLLGALPAAMTAFNGIRADVDLVRLAERSEMTAAALGRLGNAISGRPLTYDRVAGAAIRIASMMANELSEWRFVLESRRARTKNCREFR